MKKEQQEGPSQSNSGGRNLQLATNNGQIIMGDVSIHVVNSSSAKNVLAPIKVQPGEQHVTPAQATEIHALVRKVAQATGRNHGFIWETIKKKFVFAKYQLLEREKYEPVRAYLRQWIASKGVKVTSSTGRNRALARIHAESKKVNGRLEQIHQYIEECFEASSLGDLTLTQLNSVIKKFSL